MSRVRAARWCLLVLLVLVGGLLVRPSTAAAPAVDGPGCQQERRTVVHRSGVVEAAPGDYVPCLTETGMDTLESGLAVDRRGTLVRSATAGPVGVAVSADEGATWTRRPLPEGAPEGIADGWLDPVTQRYFYTGAGSGPVYLSDDLGQTWSTGVIASSTPFEGDWNKVFTGRPVTPRAEGYPTNTYYCNWTVPLGVSSPTRCWVSRDGGLHFAEAGPDLPVTPCTEPGYTPSSTHGRGAVDPRDGTVYLTVERCHQLFLLVSRDEGASWTSRLVPESRRRGARSFLDQAQDQAWLEQNASGRLNPVGARLTASQFGDAVVVDRRGRLHVTWVDGPTYTPRLTSSDDGGQTWSPSVPVLPPGVGLGILPSLTLSDAGRVGLSYYGSRDDGATWTGYLAVVDDTGTPTPRFQTAAVTRDGEPLMDEPCCWAGGAQEYTAARWAPDGSLYAAFAATDGESTARGVVGRLAPAR